MEITINIALTVEHAIGTLTLLLLTIEGICLRHGRRRGAKRQRRRR